MSPTLLRTATLFSALILLGQGCTGAAQPAKGPDGGVFKTADRGVIWAQERVLIEGPKGVSVGDEVITTLTFDPQDHKTIYAGTAARGLLASLDGGDSWQQAGALNKGRIDAVAVDAKDKCTVFASQVNKIFKTVNCGSDWAQAWFDPKTDKVFTPLIIR